MVFLLYSLHIEAEEIEPTKLVIAHLELYLRVVDFSYFVAARVAILNNLKIENSASIGNHATKVKAYY